jgi:hypothetical protein
VVKLRKERPINWIKIYFDNMYEHNNKLLNINR